MKNPKINKGFSVLSDAAFDLKAQTIIAAITGNPNFPPPIPELTAAAAAATAFSNALITAKNGSKADAAVKNEKRVESEECFFTLADYVSLIAKGNIAILVSSGFDLAKDAQPSPPLVKPEIIKVTDGVNSGELQVTISRVPGAKLYTYQYTKDPLTNNSEWTTITISSLSRMTFQNLESTKKYWCRVIAMGINEQMAYSDPVARVTQ